MAHRKNSLVIRSRVDVRTSAQKDIFIKTLENVHTVSVACKITGLTRSVVYRWRDDDADFKERWDNAIEYSAEALESAAYIKLARSYQNLHRQLTTAEVRLTEFFLTGMKPEKYSQRGDSGPQWRKEFNTIDWSWFPLSILNDFMDDKISIETCYDYYLLHMNDSDEEKQKLRNT